MKQSTPEQDLESIRSLMERSVRFLSLSGLSGILAGTYALAGAAIGYYLVYYPNSPFGLRINYVNALIPKLVAVAVAVLIASVLTAYLLSQRKAKRTGIPIWSPSTRNMLINFSIPLLAGGLLAIIFIWQGHYGAVSPMCLIFYGLALVFGGQHTFGEIRFLGLSEITLGLIAAAIPGYGLLFWALGFGVLHVFYGTIMYNKYDR